MDFYLATPTGDVYLFSHDGQALQVPPAGELIEQQNKPARAFEEIEASPE